MSPSGTLTGVLTAHPGRLIAGAFLIVIALGTVALRLPAARQGPGSATWLDAAFTSTSAVCVTGLTTVDTGGHWSTLGEAVILVLIQLGGLGIMTLATLVVLLLTGKVGVRSRLVAQTETKAARLSDVRTTIRRVVLFSLGFEAAAAVLLAARFAMAGQQSFGDAVYHGVFHAVSAFNNAGFALYPDNLVRYAGDPVVNAIIALAVIVGGLGFPVIFELTKEWRHPRRWSVLTRLTLSVTAALLLLGAVTITVLEWRNPDTLGPMPVADKLIAGPFTGVMPRTAGFNSIDVAQMSSETWLITDILMFIGGGSAGTAGGIKVTTFGLLALVIWAEARGSRSVTLGRRAVPGANQRQALAIALLGIGLVLGSTFLLLVISDVDLERCLFETTSAFATVGLTTGITAGLPEAGKVVLIGLMFAGRVGPLTIFSALAAKQRTSRVSWPEESTPVG